MARTRVALTVAFLLLATRATPQEMWFPTGPHEFRAPGPEVTTMGAPMLELSEYEQLQWGDSRHVLRELPESLSDAARFGYNFVYGGANRHFVVDRTSDGHYVVHPDMNVNGSLLDDTPMELEPRDGYHTFVRSGPRNLDSGLSGISIVFQAAVPKPVVPKYTTSGVRRPSEL